MGIKFEKIYDKKSLFNWEALENCRMEALKVYRETTLKISIWNSHSICVILSASYNGRLSIFIYIYRGWDSFQAPFPNCFLAFYRPCLCIYSYFQGLPLKRERRIRYFTPFCFQSLLPRPQSSVPIRLLWP